MTDPAWPWLPEGYTEVGRTQYILDWDGSETLATWVPGATGEMELSELKVGAGRPGLLPPGAESCRVYWGSHGCDRPRDQPAKTWCRTIRLLGSGYRHRPGYRQEWAP